MKQREIALYVILTIVTCGIFGFVWLAFMANDLKQLANEPEKMDGGLVVFLSIITCGIFMYYWYYQAGKSVEKAKYMRNMPSENASGVVYMILAFFGLSIVSMGLIQNELNNMVYVNPVNDGSDFGFYNQYTYSNSQPYDNQNYYNSEQTYGNTGYTNGYDNTNQNYNQNNYSNPNQGYNQNYNQNNYNNPDQGYNQNNNPDSTNN